MKENSLFATEQFDVIKDRTVTVGVSGSGGVGEDSDVQGFRGVGEFGGHGGSMRGMPSKKAPKGLFASGVRPGQLFLAGAAAGAAGAAGAAAAAGAAGAAGV